MKLQRPLLPLIYSLVLVSILFVPHRGDNIVPSYYERGNELYRKGDYHSALELFYQAITEREVHSQRYPWLQFKIGFCEYRIREYQKAIRTFSLNAADLQLVNDYVEYFVIRSQLALQDTAAALQSLRSFANRHPQSPLIPLIDSLGAEINYRLRNFDVAAAHYQRLLKYSYFDKGDIYGRLIEIEKIRNNGNRMEELAFQLIADHPYHPQSQAAYDELLKILGSRIPEAKFKKLYDYLAGTRQFEKAERLLRFQINSMGETELTRWLKINLLYEQGEYQQTLDACLEQRKSFSQPGHLRNIDLNIARCYLRLGYVAKSIEAYAAFQQRYPNDGLSPEVLWKIAWLYEELRNYSLARQTYEKLNRIYPRSEFFSEAGFRTGLNYYREGQYASARLVWQNALAVEKSPYEEARYQYWIAKSYLQEKDFVNYLRLLDQLTQNPFQSYYNLKAFLLTTDDTKIHRGIDSLLWEMHHDHTSYLGEFIDHLQRALVVEEVLGKLFARYEINNHLYNQGGKEWVYRFALAELHEKLGNYGKAYRLFRNVYNNHFSKKDWFEWVFLFKRLYPLYFDDEVNRNAQRAGLTPEIIWAVIKKESAFEPEIVSYANAYGLMQIIPPTARQISRELNMSLPDIRLLYDPAINIEMGAYYLTELLRRYQWNLYYALAAYNAGPHRVDRWQRAIDTSDDDFFMENIEFRETRSYVRTVMQYYWTYYLILHPQEIPDNLFSFPKKLTRESWYNEIRNH